MRVFDSVIAVVVSAAVEADAVSLAAFVLFTPATVAELVRVPVKDEARFAVTVIELAEPIGRVSVRVQRVDDPVVAQLQPAPVAVAFVRPVAGRLSVTVIGPAESDGPRLTIPIVQETGAPARGVPLTVFVIARSAAVTTVMVREAVDTVGSKVSADPVAVLVTSVPFGTFEATVADTEMAGQAAPLFSVPMRVQLNAPTEVGVLHDQPVPDAEVIVTPSGRVGGLSKTVNGVPEVPTAWSGPVFVMVMVHAFATVVPAMSGSPAAFATVISAESMCAVAVFVSVEYAPGALPVASVLSVAEAVRVLVCRFDAPVAAVADGVDEYVIEMTPQTGSVPKFQVRV